jgi:hypothetical protein
MWRVSCPVLPQRRRGQTLTVAPLVAKSSLSHSDAGAKFSAFRQASRGNRTSSLSADDGR